MCVFVCPPPSLYQSIWGLFSGFWFVRLLLAQHRLNWLLLKERDKRTWGPIPAAFTFYPHPCCRAILSNPHTLWMKTLLSSPPNPLTFPHLHTVNCSHTRASAGRLSVNSRVPISRLSASQDGGLNEHLMCNASFLRGPVQIINPLLHSIWWQWNDVHLVALDP